MATGRCVQPFSLHLDRCVLRNHTLLIEGYAIRNDPAKTVGPKDGPHPFPYKVKKVWLLLIDPLQPHLVPAKF